MKFNQDDIVRMDDGPLMIVIALTEWGTRIRCCWHEKNKYREGTFPATLLTLVDKNLGDRNELFNIKEAH